MPPCASAWKPSAWKSPCRSAVRPAISPRLFRKRSRAGAKWSTPPASARIRLQEYEFRVVVTPPFELGKILRRSERGLAGFFHDNKCVRNKPSARKRGGECLLGEALSVRRIEEGQRKRLDRMRGAKFGGVAAKHPGDAAEAECGDVLAQQRACLRAFVDE